LSSLLDEPKWQTCLMKENENNIATNVWVHGVVTKTNVLGFGMLTMGI
jgi:hypothetical protein